MDDARTPTKLPGNGQDRARAVVVHSDTIGCMVQAREMLADPKRAGVPRG